MCILGKGWMKLNSIPVFKPQIHKLYILRRYTNIVLSNFQQYFRYINGSILLPQVTDKLSHNVVSGAHRHGQDSSSQL